MEHATIIGIDLAKHSFQVHGVWCEKAAEARSVLVESPK